MAYARFNGEDSEVYVIKNLNGDLECLACRLTGEPHADGHRYGFFLADSVQHMIDHLNAHVNGGFKVPGRAFDRLKSEL